VAATWETTFAQLGENERGLLEVLSWLAPEPIPLVLLEADPLAEAIPEPRDTLAGLMGYSLARFDTPGDGVLVHRLVQEITRNRPFSTRKPEPGSWIRRFIEWFAQRHRPKPPEANPGCPHNRVNYSTHSRRLPLHLPGVKSP
jgi:hypothetical protein